MGLVVVATKFAGELRCSQLILTLAVFGAFAKELTTEWVGRFRGRWRFGCAQIAALWREPGGIGRPARQSSPLGRFLV